MSKADVEEVNFTLNEYQEMAELIELTKAHLTGLAEMFRLREDDNVYLHGKGQLYLLSAANELLALGCLIYTRAAVTFASVEDPENHGADVAYESARGMLERYTLAYLSLFPSVVDGVDNDS